jgi:translation elongation factor EF-Ts
MSTHTDEKLPPIKELTPEETWEMFDRKAREHLGISGEEFIRRYEVGEITDEQVDFDSEVAMLAMMVPFVTN